MTWTETAFECISRAWVEAYLCRDRRIRVQTDPGKGGKLATVPANANDLVLLDRVLDQRQSERTTPVSDARAFEIFAAEQALREADVAVDEIEAGVVGEGGDGAIDAVYVLLGGELLTEDHDVFQDGFTPTKVATQTTLELWLVQAKREHSYTETAIDLVASSTRRMLDLSQDEAALLKLYNPDVVARTGLFRQALRALATRHPKVEIHFVYATKGNTADVNARVAAKGAELAAQFETVMTGAKGAVEYLGAAELWERSNRFPSYTMSLPYQDEAKSENSHVVLVKLRDYFAFLTDADGNLLRHIFDWNVRDYQGDVEVNREMRESLIDEEAPEFWWLNNGVTIVCSRASSTNRTYSLDDVQVVNGLQTSHTVHAALKELLPEHPAFERSVLVRILVIAEDEVTRDRVIRATNRQTSVPAASLRATDQIQRDIEAFFTSSGWFYDRRKNYYRNMGKSAERIVSIPLLAQSVMAMGLGRPDISRARPSSLLKRQEDYDRVFSATLPLPVYLWLARAQKAVDTFLMSEEARSTPGERTNFRFHLSMVAAARLAGARVYNAAQLRDIVESGKQIEHADLKTCLAIIRLVFIEFSGGAVLYDRIAKGQDFVDALQARMFEDPSTWTGEQLRLLETYDPAPVEGEGLGSQAQDAEAATEEV